ncbi:hypothetical protein YC2023_121468 [Brassica napus]
MSICCNIASLWEHQLVAWVRYSERNRQARGRGAIVLLKVFLHKFRSDDSWELLIDYQWQRNNEKKQVSGFCSTRKRNQGVGFAGHSLDLEAKSSSLCEKSQVIAKVQGSLITDFSGLRQCEKVSEVLRISLQELQRFKWSSRVQHVVICCEEDVGSQHEFLKEHVFTGTQEQFEVELFETITKLNKIMENSLRGFNGNGFQVQCKRLQGDAKGEQVCSSTKGKLKKLDEGVKKISDKVEIVKKCVI